MKVGEMERESRRMHVESFGLNIKLSSSVYILEQQPGDQLTVLTSKKTDTEYVMF